MTFIQHIAILVLTVVWALPTGTVRDSPMVERGPVDDDAHNQQQIIINPLDDPTAACNYSKISEIVADELEGVSAEMKDIQLKLNQLKKLLKNSTGKPPIKTFH